MSLFLSHKYLNPFEEHKNGTYHHVAPSLSGPKSLYFKSRGELFLWNRIWYLSWFWLAGRQYIKYLQFLLKYFWGCYFHVIRMSNLRHTMVDGAEFWISCKRPAYLSSFSRLQLIQKLAPSTIMWHQCDIRIEN